MQLWEYQLSPSAARPAAEVDRLFTVIFGLDVKRWLKTLKMKQGTEDNTPCEATTKKTLMQDYQSLHQAVSMGGSFDTEVSTYPFFYLFYTAVRRNFQVRIGAVIHETQRGPNYTADCGVVECRYTVC